MDAAEASLRVYWSRVCRGPLLAIREPKKCRLVSVGPAQGGTLPSLVFVAQGWSLPQGPVCGTSALSACESLFWKFLKRVGASGSLTYPPPPAPHCSPRLLVFNQQTPPSPLTQLRYPHAQSYRYEMSF